MSAIWLDTLLPPGQRGRVLRGPRASTRGDIRFMDLGRCNIRYRVCGEGSRTLVLAADPPVVLELYDELIACLSPHFRIVVFEPPAFGFSLPKPGLRFEFEALTDVMREFLEGLGLGPYILAFPCVPAYSAIWLAGRRPDLVSGLVVMQAPDWHEELGWKRRRDPKGLLGRPYLGQAALRVLRRRRAGNWYKLALGRADLLAPFTRETEEAFDHGACFSLASAFQRFLVEDEPDFGTVRQPALVVWGCADSSHAETAKDSIGRYLPQARMVKLPKAGHFPELEDPQRFTEELLASFGRK